MYPARIIPVLLLFFALGCKQQDSPQLGQWDESRKPKDQIVGRWESENAAWEFTPSGSLVRLGQGKSAQYEFVDDRTIEVNADGEKVRFTDVSISGDELTVTSKDKTEKFNRVKDFSARIHEKFAEATKQSIAKIQGARLEDRGGGKPNDNEPLRKKPTVTTEKPGSPIVPMSESKQPK